MKQEKRERNWKSNFHAAEKEGEDETSLIKLPEFLQIK